MNLGTLLSPEIPVLKPDETIESALAILDAGHYAELPVVAADEYLALVREHDLLNASATGKTIAEADLLQFKPAISAVSHPFEALKLVHQLSINVLPVIDNEHKYLGSISGASLLNYMAGSSGIETAGGIIVLEIAPRNYTLYEIARICENEDVMIVNLQVNPNAAGMLEVTLKFNSSSLGPVVASLERHDYHVVEYYGDQNNDDDLSNNYRLLMNYIGM